MGPIDAATAIETALDRRRIESPDLDSFFSHDRLNGFFVKNLENVQGDERDVIIFSVGYGHDERGDIAMSFGPLNYPGGVRRLNVAITRARRCVEVVSSIEPGDFKASTNDGVRHLKRYLDYARRGPEALALEIGESKLDAESPFEEEVIRTIRTWGYDVEPQVGTARYRVDIGVRHPDKPGLFVLGVECDGAMYHSSKVARDRDRIRQDVLERLGWRIYRIWGTAWYRHRVDAESKLKSAIEDAVSEGDAFTPRRHRPLEAQATADEATFDAVALDQAPSWTTPYVVCSPQPPHRSGIEMHLPAAQADIRRMIVQVVGLEGPVQDELVLRRIREAWGIGRAGQRIRTAFDGAIRASTRRGEIQVVERNFLVTNTAQMETVRVPGDNEAARRKVDEISILELSLAVQRLVEDARRVTRDELTREVARLFGWNRRGPDITTALNRAVEGLLAVRIISDNGDYLVCPPSSRA